MLESVILCKEVVQGMKGGKVFLGEYKHTMDAKGRIVIPSRFRDELKQGCVVTKGQDNCLQILTNKAWKEEANTVAGLSKTNKTSRQIARSLFSGAIDVALDSAGKILIPENLRLYSFMKYGEPITITGSGSVIEIWATKQWKKVQLEADKAFANLNELTGGS